MIEEIATRALDTLGIQGVSTVAVVALVSVALYAHKASAVGGVAVSASSTLAHDLKIIALVLTGLLVIGVVNADVQRTQEVVQLAQSWLARQNLLEQLWRVVP